MATENQTLSRRIPACERCRIRKTKCDSQLPSCSNCTKAGAKCMQKHKVLGKEITRSSLWSFEERIRSLEGDEESFQELSEAVQHGRKRAKPPNGQNKDSTKIRPSPATSSGTRFLSHLELPPTPVVSDSYCCSMTSAHDDDDTAQSTMDTLFAASFFGESASPLNVSLDNQSRQYTSASRRSAREIFIEQENMALSKLGRSFIEQEHQISPRNRVTDITSYDYTLLVAVAKRYFSWMNSAYPVLHECIFHLQLQNFFNRPKEASIVDHFQVNMVIAISLVSIGRPHLPMSEIGRIANDFWKAATKFSSHVLFVGGIEKLQNILLLLQYTLLVPRAGNLWQLSGSAMRYATEMGLYAEPNPSQQLDPLTLDLRRRIFWTCYCIDRMLATVMGRPIGIPDAWISTKYPALVEDELVTVYGIKLGPVCQLKVAQTQQMGIYRLQSEIHQYLYAPGNLNKLSHKEMATWSWQMYDQLRLWRSSFSYPTPMITKEWTELQFHIAVVLLFRPSPNRSDISDEALHAAFHSAGEGMKLVKIMHRECSAVFSWLTVQNLFMCGLTFVNSLKELAERRKSQHLCVSFVEIFLQIQSCTAMLETMSALEAGANERIRNAFEVISSNILQSITNIAAPLPQHSNHAQCIWSKIAKSDNISLLRPTLIEGINIPIRQQSAALEGTLEQNRSKFSDGYDDKHFSEHDIDSSNKHSMLNLPLNTDLYTVFKRHELNRDSEVVNQSGHSSGDRNHGSVYQPDYGLSNPDNSLRPLVEPVGSRLGRKDTILGTATSRTDPLSDINTIPDLSESNLGAELERWFLYPLPESSGRFDS